MKLFFRDIRLSGVAISLFVLIMLLLSIYFFVRLSRNQQDLEQRGFRALNQLGVAMKEKDTVIRKVVENISYKLQDNQHSWQRKSSIKQNLHSSTLPYSIDSLIYFKRKNESSSTKETIRKNLPAKNVSFPRFDGVSNIDSSSKLVTKSVNASTSGIEPSSKKEDTFLGDSLYKMSIQDFVAPLLQRRDFFSHYVLLRNDTIVFSTLGGDAHLSKEKFKKAEIQNSMLSFSNLSNKTNEDSVLLIQAGFCQTVNIQGKNYIFFAIPLKMNSKPDWYLGGLVEEKAFLSWKRNLPSEIVVAFCVLLLAIIFSFPILKVFLSGPLEKLSRVGISLTGISLIISPALIIILMSEFLLSSTTKLDAYENLSVLNSKIRQEFLNESDSILLQLKDYQNADFEKHKDTVFTLSRSNIDFLKPFNYRLFKAFFPADLNGKQLFYLTPYKYGDTSNVATRDYFICSEKFTRIIPKRKGGTITADTIWYNMEPIYSNTSGEWIMAFSIPASKPEVAKIVALTSAMYSLKWPLLPEDFRFCLIEKSGKIWFDSKEIFNLSDNLIDETDHSEQLVQALRSNISSKFRANLRNKKNLMFVAPVDNTQLYIVTMFDPAINNSMEALSATFVIACFAVIYLLLFLLIILIKLIRHKPSKLKGREYFFSWLTPKESKADVYKILLIFNGIIIFILFGLSFLGAFTRLGLNTFVWIFLIFVSLHYPALYLIRNIIKSFGGVTLNLKLFTDNYLTLFTLFLFSSLIVSSILPAMFMMSRLSTAENKLSIIRQQQDLAYKINKRTELLMDFAIANYPEDQRIRFLNERNQKGLYYQAVCVSDRNEDIPGRFSDVQDDDYLTSPFVRLRRAEFQEMMGLETPLIDDRVSKSKPFYNKTANQIMLTYNKVSYSEKGGKIKEEDTLLSKNFGLQMFRLIDGSKNWKWNTTIFWGAFILVMLLLYFLVKNIVKRIFPYQELVFKGVDADILFKKVSNGSKSAVVVSIGKAENFPTNEQGFSCIDLDNFAPKNSPDGNISMFLINFEKGINNPVDLEKKLKLFEVFSKQKPVVLQLSKTPSQLLNYYNELWRNELNPNFCKTQLRHFERLVSGLAVFYLKPYDTEKGKNNTVSTFDLILEKELGFNPAIEAFIPFLELDFAELKMHPDFSESRKWPKISIAGKAEDFILKIQEYGCPFYNTVWNSLSKEEQFVLMDLAEDSIVNMNNRECLQSLINKGILKLNDTLEFASQSFRNFILTDVDKTEIEAMQKSIQITGNWNRLRIPLILVAASIAVFLFVTQQNFLSTLNTFLVSIITIAGTFLRFSGMFSKGKGV